MILTVELQRQLSVGDVSPGAVERGGVLSALTLAEDEVAVGSAAESGGAGNHVYGIIVIHLPQVMHQQNGDAVLVRQRFQNTDVPVVAGIRVCVIARGADALERVDDDEPGLRKMNDDDPMNMISGTTGLSGATDSNFVLRKSQRRENTATLYCTGRDIPYRELALEFDGEDHVWKLLSDDCEQAELPSERILFLLSELLRQQPEISAPAKVLLEKIDPAGAEGLTPNSFSHRIRKSVDALRRNGITVSFRKSNGDRLICLKRADGVDDLTTENIVTIDPENPPCFAV